ncbi:MAG: homoserine dehydrogenase [Opitutales bacterium]|nr:homoserine dehydrogenase [Opitutales bacterium]
MEQKVYRIGFIGMGTVGQGVWKHLQIDQERMQSRFGATYKLAKACVRDISKKRDIVISAEQMTEDPYDVVNDPSIDIVCELMGGTGKALELTLAALKQGKAVVSANKAVISKYGAEIFETAEKFGGKYFFEASVAGGIPIIKILREGLVANSFSHIYGILNGTCNYILTRMEREKAPYEAIVEDARRLGYVEADESLDLDGWDAAHKTSILVYLAHGVWANPEKEMLVSGIRGIRLEDMLWANENNSRIKLVGSARKYGDSLSVSVYPAILPLTDVVANVNEVYNAVALSGDVVGRTIHIGRGAGQDATASAVIADIADALKTLSSGASNSLIVAKDANLHFASLEEISGEFYLRLEIKDKAGVLASVASVLASEGISIELLQQKKHEIEGRAWLLLTTHSTDEAAIKRACDKLEKSDLTFDERPFVLRIFR